MLKKKIFEIFGLVMASAGRAGTTVLELVKRVLAKQANSGGGLDKLLLGKVKVISADKGVMSAVMTIGHEHSNAIGSLHGGMTTYLVDMLSSVTLATCPEVKNLGVSVNINMTFIKGATIGQEVEIISRVDKAGAKLAFLSTDIVDKTTGELIAKGAHTKYIAIKLTASEIQR